MIIKIAWRNIWRNLRRSLITLGAITFGLASVIIFFGLTDGFHVQMVDNMVKTTSGHIVIHTAGYNDDPKVSKRINDTSSIIKKIKTMPKVVAYSERIEVAGLASTPENSVGVMIRGVNPSDENNITGLKKRVHEGSYLENETGLNKHGILVGHRMLKRLGAGLGDKIVLMVQGADGSLGAELFRVKGVLRMGSVDLDTSYAVITTEGARKLTALTSGFNEVSLLVDTPDDVVPVAKELKNIFTEPDFEVLTWQEVMPALQEMIELDDIFMYIILFIVLIVVSLGILNTMLMSIMERTREFGVMMALGTKPLQIVHLVIAEASILGAVGTTLGVTIGVSTNALLSIKGIDFTQWSDALEFVGMVTTVVYPETGSDNILIAAAIVYFTTVLVSIYPAIKASKQSPVEAIRHI